MTILDQIIADKFKEITLRKDTVPLVHLGHRPYFERPTISLKNKLKKQVGIISEFKRRSPSKGVIREEADVLSITQSYEAAGAAACSILTDSKYFDGRDQDIIDARPFLNIPILRKEFIIDPYQIMEAKAMGADVILLIAACLSVNQVKQLAGFARNLGLNVLLELHGEDELGHICDETGLVGINNRDLKPFEVDINRSLQLSRQIPADKVIIAESGIDKAETIKIFKEAGYKGFLIGETFMKQKDPGKAFGNFVKLL